MDEIKIKHLGVKAISKEYYEELKSKTKTFPYVDLGKWTGFLSSKDEKYSIVVFASGMRVIARLVDKDTGIVKLRIKYFDRITDVQRDYECTILSKLGVKELYRYGIRFSEEDSNIVVKYLLKSEAIAPVICSYSKLGWDEECGKRIFRGHSAFSEEGTLDELIYGGQLDLNPTGELEKWLAMVKTEVLKSTAMTIIMLLGFAGALVALLNQKKDIGSIMFSLSNRSSKGKTTSAMLAVSVCSSPILNRGCAISFNSTENALIQFISSCGGHTVVIDEVALSHSKDFSKLMYSICNGRSKMRLNGDATQKEVTEFNGIVISTAEFGLINEDTPNGIKARVFEIKDTLTDSAENSDRIKACIFQNHALAGEPFVKYLLQKGEGVFEDYEKDKKYLCDKCADKKELSERIFSKLAPIMTTARYVNDIFQMGIDLEMIANYLLNLECQVSAEVKPEERMVEIIRQEVSRNASRYVIDKKTANFCSCCGAVKTLSENKSEIQISQTEFERIMEEHGVNDWKSTLKMLKKQGILQTEGDRLSKRVTLVEAVGRVKCYCFLLKNEEGSKCSKQNFCRNIEELSDVDILDQFTNGIID